jgi:outer membrane biosynthesis protein TonB
MPHVSGHGSPHSSGTSYGPVGGPKPPKPKPKPKPRPKPTGSPGYTPPEERRKTSGFDPNKYPSGVLTETGAGGGQQVTYNVLDPDKARTVTTQQPTTTTTTTDTTTDTEDKKYTDYEYYFDANGNLDLRKVRKKHWILSKNIRKKNC